MKIRLEMPKGTELPSQGRNADSISAGGAREIRVNEIIVCRYALKGHVLVPAEHYRAWVNGDEKEPEFVFFVGWTATADRLVFEDAAGDLLAIAADEIDIS